MSCQPVTTTTQKVTTASVFVNQVAELATDPLDSTIVKAGRVAAKIGLFPQEIQNTIYQQFAEKLETTREKLPPGALAEQYQSLCIVLVEVLPLGSFYEKTMESSSSPRKESSTPQTPPSTPPRVYTRDEIINTIERITKVGKNKEIQSQAIVTLLTRYDHSVQTAIFSQVRWQASIETQEDPIDWARQNCANHLKLLRTICLENLPELSSTPKKMSVVNTTPKTSTPQRTYTLTPKSNFEWYGKAGLGAAIAIGSVLAVAASWRWASSIR